MGRVVLITGATSGVGKACAEKLAASGFTVYGASRRVDENAQPPGLPYRLLRGDVTDADSVRACVQRVIAEVERIDVLINCAGFTMEGGVEDCSPEEVFEQFDTNVFGAHRMCREVLPHMRRCGGGLIINMSSVASEFVVPFQSFYSLTKTALDGLTVALRMEGRAFGVQATCINPGDIRSGFTAARRRARAFEEGSPYYEMARRSVEQMRHDEMAGMSPERVARLALKVVKRRRVRSRYFMEPKYRLLVFLKRLAPERLVERGVWSIYVGR
jgi:NAD(P)-dependent dehydrogenase (short-subunit alcohol dehydrogenase family)